MCDNFHKHNIEYKKPDMNAYLLHDWIYMEHKDRQNFARCWRKAKSYPARIVTEWGTWELGALGMHTWLLIWVVAPQVFILWNVTKRTRIICTLFCMYVVCR